MIEITFYDQPYPGVNWDGAKRYDEYAKIRAKIEGAYLGPWCPDCGKKGTKCRKRDACRLRSITLRRPAACSLERPPDEWIVARGFGRWNRVGAYGSAYWHMWLSDSQKREARRQYAYELAMGKADVGEQVAA